MIDSLKRPCSASLALIGALSLPASAEDRPSWQEALKALNVQFATECVLQQANHAVQSDYDQTLGGINDKIQRVLEDAGFDLIHSKTSGRFWVTDTLAKPDGDYAMTAQIDNGKEYVAKRFPTCGR